MDGRLIFGLILCAFICSVGLAIGIGTYGICVNDCTVNIYNQRIVPP